MLHSKKPNVFRFRQDLPPWTPLAIRSVGHYQLYPNSLVEAPAIKWFCEIFWSVSGSGIFQIGEQSVTVHSGQIFYLLPGERHDLQPSSDGWEYYWFTLDHELAPSLLEAFGFDERPFDAAKCPVDSFRELERAVREASLSGDREASHWAHAILLETLKQRGQSNQECPSDWATECKHYMDTQFQNANLNIADIAQRMGVHRTTLFRAFKKSYLMTPSAYLQNRRLHQAIHLLKNSNMPVQEIALRIGMPDTNYLARIIKKATGLAPLRFRASHQ